MLLASSSQAQKISFSDTTNSWTVKYSTYSVHNNYNTLWALTGPNVVVDTFTYQQFNKVAYQQFYNEALIRDDTANSRVYVKLLPLYAGIDTTEQILYDYNLKVGDTIRKRYKIKDTTEHFVQKIDSILINNVYHKVWHLQHLKPMVGHLGYSYWVIEGIGSMNGPLYPLATTGFEHHYGLICFETNNALVTVPSKQNLSIAAYMGNILSPTICALTIDEVANENHNVTISPHPANSMSRFNLPYSVSQGEVSVYNTLGQVISEQLINNQQSVPVSQNELGTGIYLYKITDNQLGKSWQGKLIYE